MKINATLLLLIGSFIFLCLVYLFYTQGYFTGRVIVFRAYYLSMPYLAPTLINSLTLAISGICILMGQKSIAAYFLLYSGIGFFADRLLTYFLHPNLYMYSYLRSTGPQALNVNYIIEVYFPLVLAGYVFICLIWLVPKNKARSYLIFSILAVVVNVLFIILARILIDDKFYQILK